MAFSLLYKNSRTFLVVQLSPFPAPSQPQPPTPESQDPYPAPATVPGSLQPQASCCSNFGGRLLPGPGFGLAAAGSWRRGQVEVELRQATGGLGHAGLGRQKQVKKKSIGTVKKKSIGKVKKK